MQCMGSGQVSHHRQQHLRAEISLGHTHLALLCNTSREWIWIPFCKVPLLKSWPSQATSKPVKPVARLSEKGVKHIQDEDKERCRQDTTVSLGLLQLRILDCWEILGLTADEGGPQ